MECRLAKMRCGEMFWQNQRRGGKCVDFQIYFGLINLEKKITEIRHNLGF